MHIFIQVRYLRPNVLGMWPKDLQGPQGCSWFALRTLMEQLDIILYYTFNHNNWGKPKNFFNAMPTDRVRSQQFDMNSAWFWVPKWSRSTKQLFLDTKKEGQRFFPLWSNSMNCQLCYTWKLRPRGRPINYVAMISIVTYSLHTHHYELMHMLLNSFEANHTDARSLQNVIAIFQWYQFLIYWTVLTSKNELYKKQ